MRGFPRPDPKKKIVWQTIGQAKQPSAGQKMKAGKRESGKSRRSRQGDGQKGMDQGRSRGWRRQGSEQGKGRTRHAPCPDHAT